MQKNKFILLFITTTILATIGLQVHWNIKNYKENRVRLISEVQIAFDNGIENYFAEESKKHTIAFFSNDTVKDNDFVSKLMLDTVFSQQLKKKKPNVVPRKTDSIHFKTNIEFNATSTKNKETFKPSDSPRIQINSAKALNKRIIARENFDDIHVNSIAAIRVAKGKKSVDSINLLDDLANKVIITVNPDSVDFQKLNTALIKELDRKKIDISYKIEHFKRDTLFDSFEKNKAEELSLSTFAKEAFLPYQKLKLSFNNPTYLLLQRSLVEISLSLLLSLSIIACLLYLLKIINRQKKVDEIKNDLISNITHEFKTPITTISSAIEGIRNFNAVNDTEKTNRYLAISSQQLSKLGIMVEKLLETASLETDKVILKKEPLNIAELLQSNVEKHQMNAPEKTISFVSSQEEIVLDVDLFHFENAISNIIDNAVKYGGNEIEVSLESNKKKIEIIVRDNGIGIEKSQREKIFEKFYRIPKGNVHDVKGFGIGLYYSKKIIEKHHGTLELIVDSKTNFKISLADV